jgi:hypothetical protein
MEEIKSKILRLLANEQLKPNKLRKKVMDAGMKAKFPDLTWDDFAAQLKSLEEAGQVLKVPDPSEPNGELCCLPNSDVKPTQAKPKPVERKKRALDMDIKESVNVVGEDGEGGEGESAKKPKLQVTIDLPEKFIPFLLRQEGAKLKNIETNSKTKIQCDQKKVPQSSQAEAGRAIKSPLTNIADLVQKVVEAEGVNNENETRSIVITGFEEKHLKTAQVLINSMLNAFHKNGKGKPVYNKDKKRPSNHSSNYKGKKPSNFNKTHDKKSDSTSSK